MQVNLSIKGVPQEIAERLRERAARNHRSLQGELMAIVSRAAAQMGEEAPDYTDEPGSGLGRETSQLMNGSESYRHGTMTVDEVVAALRERLPKPVTDEPRSVDIVRAARDAR